MASISFVNIDRLKGAPFLMSNLTSSKEMSFKRFLSTVCPSTAFAERTAKQHAINKMRLAFIYPTPVR
jgi:hypothetical protein